MNASKRWVLQLQMRPRTPQPASAGGATSGPAVPASEFRLWSSFLAQLR